MGRQFLYENNGDINDGFVLSEALSAHCPDFFPDQYNLAGIYRQNLASILSPDVNWGAAIAFYLIYIAGILIFAVIPAIQRDSIARAMVWGGLFGFFTYATYDLTNLALIRDWPLKVVVVDILWGIVLCASVASLSFRAAKWIG